jgi:hypothetical protein
MSNLIPEDFMYRISKIKVTDSNANTVESARMPNSSRIQKIVPVIRIPELTDTKKPRNGTSSILSFEQKMVHTSIPIGKISSMNQAKYKTVKAGMDNVTTATKNIGNSASTKTGNMPQDSFFVLNVRE